MDIHYPNVAELMHQQKSRRQLLVSGLIFTLLASFGIVASLFYFANASQPVAFIAGFTAVIVIATPIVVWNWPRMGFYLLLGATMVFEGVSNGYGQTDTIPTTFIPFFWNINNVGANYGTSALEPLKFSIAEVIIVMTLLSWAVRAIVLRNFKLERGAFFGWFAAYIGMVAFGWVRGVMTGGDATMALWEVRSQFHLFAAYLIGANLITERKHVITVLWVTIIGIGIKGLIGLWAFAHTPVITEQGVLYHEESLFFNVLMFVLFMTWLTNADNKMKWVSLVLIPACIFTVFQNQRRSGIAAFIVAFIPLLPILWVMLKDRRKQVKAFAIGFGLFSAVYLPLGWNASGSWALPARAIRSNSDPSARDASSDYYRLAENINLKATRDQSPIVGIGYGKPYLMLVYQPGIDQFDRFLKYLPHNSLMWVWMRIGHVGFFFFMMVMAVVCIKGVQILKRTRDPALHSIGVLGIVAPIMLFTFGKYDLAIVNYRVVIMTGAFMGVLSVLHKIEKRTLEPQAAVYESDLDLYLKERQRRSTPEGDEDEVIEEPNPMWRPIRDSRVGV